MIVIPLRERQVWFSALLLSTVCLQECPSYRVDVGATFGQPPLQERADVMKQFLSIKMDKLKDCLWKQTVLCL